MKGNCTINRPGATKLHVNTTSAIILGLQPRDKTAMLVVNTKEIFLLNLHQNRVHFPAERNAFVLDHQHGRRDVTCKPAMDGHHNRNTKIRVFGVVLERFSRLYLH